MSSLFSPIELRGLKLSNRIMVSPMCQYSAEGGSATDWHFTHINSLALSGAAMFCIEATHVEDIGRITPGCLGLYNDACEAALKRILAAVRKHSSAAVAMQLAHAGRKGSSARPWEGGQQIPIAQGGWQAVAPSAVAHKDGEAAPRALDDAVDLGYVAIVNGPRYINSMGHKYIQALSVCSPGGMVKMVRI